MWAAVYTTIDTHCALALISPSQFSICEKFHSIVYFRKEKGFKESCFAAILCAQHINLNIKYQFKLLRINSNFKIDLCKQTNFSQHWSRHSFRKNITIANETPWTLWGSDLVIPVLHRDAQTIPSKQKLPCLAYEAPCSHFSFVFFSPVTTEKSQHSTVAFPTKHLRWQNSLRK